MAAVTINKEDGVWVLYNYDYGPQAVSIHKSELGAIMAHKGESIAFWPFGKELRDAVKDWEESTKS